MGIPSLAITVETNPATAERVVRPGADLHAALRMLPDWMKSFVQDSKLTSWSLPTRHANGYRKASNQGAVF